ETNDEYILPPWSTCPPHSTQGRDSAAMRVKTPRDRNSTLLCRCRDRETAPCHKPYIDIGCLLSVEACSGPPRQSRCSCGLVLYGRSRRFRACAHCRC